MTKNQRRNFLRRRAERKEKAGPTTTSGVKRPRDATDFTPSPNKEERKKPKTEGLRYSQVVSCLKVAITHRDYHKGELTEEVADNLAAKLVDLMRDNKPEEGKLTFCGFSFRTGALVINCADERSRNWMGSAVGGLSPWEGTPLKVCDPKELEGFVRISMFLPKPVKGIDLALANLKAQNGINTSMWKVLPGGTKMHAKGLYFVASIPESQYKMLGTQDYRLSHGLHLVEVRKLKEKEPGKEKGAEKMEVQEDKEGEKQAGVEDAGSGTAAEGGAAGKPAAVAGENPDLIGNDRRTSGEASQQPPKGRAEPVTAGGQQGAPSADVEGSKAVGKNRTVRGKPDGDPPPPSKQ